MTEEKAELQQNLQTHRLTVQNQELQQQVPGTGLHNYPPEPVEPDWTHDDLTGSVWVQNLNHEQQNLKSRLDEAETARTQAEEQVRTGLEPDRQCRRSISMRSGDSESSE